MSDKDDETKPQIEKRLKRVEYLLSELIEQTRRLAEGTVLIKTDVDVLKLHERYRQP